MKIWWRSISPYLFYVFVGFLVAFLLCYILRILGLLGMIPGGFFLVLLWLTVVTFLVWAIDKTYQ